jgi:type IV pilus assembly protein PilC
MSIDLSSYENKNHKNGSENKSNKSSVQGRAAWMNRDIKFFSSGIKMREKEAFFLEFSVLLKAGLDFKNALEIVTESLKGNIKDSTFITMQRDIINGASLADAMSNTGKFSQYDIYSIKIAEESGKLDSVLTDLAIFYGKNLENRRLLTSALSYPVIVIITAMLSISFLLNFLVPMFNDVYKRLNQELPALTQIIVSLSVLFAKYTIPFLLFLSLIVILAYSQRKSEKFRQASSWLMLRVPLVGSLLQQLYLTRFCTAMSFLNGSKVPVLEALSLIEKMINFYPLEQAIRVIKDDVMRGVPLHVGMKKFSIFPKRMIALIKVGEEVNRLDQMFERLAEQYTKESEHRIKSLGSMIEPILIVFLAIIVGIILVAMYLPIFKLVSNFGG